MKILQISSGVLPVPPPGYGGLEQIVFDLSLSLAEMGHEVSIVCPDDSTADQFHENIRCVKRGPREPNAHQWEQNAHDRAMEEGLYKQFDIIHSHDWRKPVYVAVMQDPSLKVISTVHGMCPYNQPPPVSKPCFVGLSKSHAMQISSILGINVKFCYNGIDLTRYAFNGGERTDRYLFLARINHYKAPHEFLNLLKAAKVKGDVVGDDVLVEDPSYVERILLMVNDMGGQATYWGGVNRERAAEFFRKAKAYILPLLPPWSEPFGLTPVESLAAGTPVIATLNGALPEIVQHGVHGYLSPYVQDLSRYMTDEALSKIDPQVCRARAQEFSRQNMAQNYLALYEECLNGGW